MAIKQRPKRKPGRSARSEKTAKVRRAAPPETAAPTPTTPPIAPETRVLRDIEKVSSCPKCGSAAHYLGIEEVEKGLELHCTRCGWTGHYMGNGNAVQGLDIPAPIGLAIKQRMSNLKIGLSELSVLMGMDALLLHNVLVGKKEAPDEFEDDVHRLLSQVERRRAAWQI